MNNYQQYNETVRAEMEASFKKPLSLIIRNEPWTRFSKVFQCTECGSFLSAPVVSFFDGDVMQARCYLCQRK